MLTSRYSAKTRFDIRRILLLRLPSCEHYRVLNEPDGPNGTTRTIANITAAVPAPPHVTPQYEYSNVTCVGARSAPSASNQVTLGDTAVTEVKTSGVILPGGYKASDGSAGISKTITITDKSDVTHTLVFKDGLLTSHTTS